MITLRMVAIAVAMLVGIPVAIVAADHMPDVPGGTVHEAEAEARAMVTDIALIDPPDRYVRAENEFRPEQLVEGHIVFITIDLQRVLVEENFTFDIVGNVSCDFGASGEGEFFLGLPWPTDVDEGFVRCQAGDKIFVTPDPFIEGDDVGFGSTVTPFVPVSTSTAKAPNGETIDVEEYAFDVITYDAQGAATSKTYSAWSVPVLQPWTHTDGSTKSWFCPIPEDRLREMGVSMFNAYHESELPSEYWAS